MMALRVLVGHKGWVGSSLTTLITFSDMFMVFLVMYFWPAVFLTCGFFESVLSLGFL